MATTPSGGIRRRTDTSSVLDMLCDRSFSAFFSEHMFDYRTKDEFSQLAIPHSIDVESAWEIVSGMRKMFSTHVPSVVPTPLGDDIWYCLTPPMNGMLTNITTRSRTTGSLFEALRRRLHPGFIVEPVLDELAAAFRRDGISLDRLP